jgi:ribosome maturation factor RimP
MESKHFNKNELLQNLTPLIENTAMRYNLVPIEIDFLKESGKWFLKIFLYSEKGVSLDDCENVSRSLNPFLDELIPMKFYLEVSSPGLERKIKSDREYIVFNGKEINLKLKNLQDDLTEKQFLCQIADFDPNNGLTVLKLDSKKKYLIPKDNIYRAQLHLDID